MTVTLTHNAIAYTLHRLMDIVAPAQQYTVCIEAGNPSVQLTRELSICFSLIPETDWPKLLAGEYPMTYIPSYDHAVTVPLLLEKGNSFAVWNGNILEVHADIITLSFLLLSRAEEELTPERDRYDRFLWKNSLAAKYSFIDFPIVDEWAMLLRSALSERVNMDSLGRHAPSLRLTHDMDSARRFPNLFVAARTILGGDLLRLKSFRIAAKSFRQYITSRTHPEKDPSLLGAQILMELSLLHGFISEFYFMGLETGEDDFRYDVSAPAVQAAAQQLTAAGMICGFHGSRLTPKNTDRFRLEQQRVANALKLPIRCGRQHYLCFDALETPRIWQEAGMVYDDTLGYADHEGFRCGTCHEYPLYDLKKDQPLTVIERPLIAMDATLMEYRGLICADSLKILKQLFLRCYAVEGDFVLLWHNDSLFREWEPWFEQVYRPFIKWAAERLGKEKTH